MTVTIPTSEAQYGYVVGRVIRAVGDTTDADDKPDAVAAVGSVSFTPKAQLGRTTNYSAFIVREKLTAPLDAQGNLVRYEGATPAGIALTVGAYRVEFTLNSGNIPGFDIEVTPAHTEAAPLDLVTAAPYVPPTGVTVNTMLVPADAVVGQVLSWSASGLDWVDMAAAAGAVSSVAGRTGAVVLSSADISDSTATGRSLLTAADAAAARTAIGAGMSNLAIGTTGTTAAAGNRQATTTAIGMVELATTAEATAGTDTTRAVTPAGLKAAVDSLPAGGTDTEAVQDIVGAMVAGAGGTYDDTAGTITLPSGGGGGGSAGAVQFVVAREGASVPVGASSFTTYPLNGTPTVNIGGGSWNAGTYAYTVPSSGLYLCLGMIRLSDNSAERSTALAIGTTNADGPHVDWSVMGGTYARQRSSRQYVRLTRFTTGDQVRMYIYSDGATFPTHDASGQYMSIIKLAD